MAIEHPATEPTRAERLTLVMKMYEVCVAQEKAIKDEENGWVRTYWAFYAAIAAFGTYAFRMSPPTEIAKGDDFRWSVVVIGMSLCGVSGFATVWFLSQMMQLRHSYYDVRERLLRACRLLKCGADSPGEWGELTPMQRNVELLSEMKTTDDYDRLTKPDATFSQRLQFLLVGHCAASLILSVGVVGLTWVGSGLLCMGIVLGLSVVGSLIAYSSVLKQDFQHFVKVSGGKLRRTETGPR